MYTLLLASWLCLPAFPLNPVAQDTIASLNAHFTVGLSGPNSLVGSGPEITSKYEIRLIHPVVVRAAFDYRFGKVNSILFPRGTLHSATVSTDALYYRGTHKLTGYLGLGLVYTFHHYHLTNDAADSLRENHQVQDVGIRPTFGLRITMGLRFHRTVSLEIGITEARPNLKFVRRLSEKSYSVTTERIRLSDVRITLGYLWPLSRW